MNGIWIGFQVETKIFPLDPGPRLFGGHKRIAGCKSNVYDKIIILTVCT